MHGAPMLAVVWVPLQPTTGTSIYPQDRRHARIAPLHSPTPTPEYNCSCASAPTLGRMSFVRVYLTTKIFRRIRGCRCSHHRQHSLALLWTPKSFIGQQSPSRNVGKK
ncbi:hypothetical protein BJV74DRAFT_547799 [Russula compacta]|nr:hypothetical protein BJV74DRAFT_547799 [Russula compacta]